VAEKNPPYVLQNRTDHKSDMFRLMLSGLTGRYEGVFSPLDLIVTQDTGSNMNSRVGTGGMFVFGDENIVQGLYAGYNDAAATLTHSAAPGTPGQSRRDLVVARVEDQAYSGSTNAWSLAIVAGVAASSPVDPSIPANAVVLARVVIAFGQTTVTNANITDLRPRMVANGGVGVGNSARRPGVALGPLSINSLGGPAQAVPEAGALFYETDTSLLQLYNGTVWVPIANSGAWQSYTPVWTTSGGGQALNNGSLSGRYVKVGRMCQFHIYMAFGTTSNGGIGTYSFTLPFQTVGVFEQLTTAKLFCSNGTSNWIGIGYSPANGTTVSPYFPISPTISHLNPFRQDPTAAGVPNIGTYQMSNLSNMSIFGWYETAS
jgi:hypothetical protein